MSHRILKPTMTEPQGIFTDLSDIAEGYYYWVKNEIAGSWLDFKRSKGWTIHASDRWTIHHATDDDDCENVKSNIPYTRV